jgi:thiol-disulfide isomerase/thioredoxin
MLSKSAFSAFVSILFMLVSCTTAKDKNYKSFILKGKIIGQESGFVILKYMPYANMTCDTVKIENGRFVFKGIIPEPLEAEISGGNDLNTTKFYLEPSKMRLYLVKDKFQEYILVGSKTQDEKNELTKLEKPIYDRIKPLRKRSFEFQDSLENTRSIIKKEEFVRNLKEVNIKWAQARQELDQVYTRFILENPESYISSSSLHILDANEVITLDSLKSMFYCLHTTIQNSKYGRIIKEDIRKKENIRIGAQAPDFKATALNKRVVTLSQFNSKSVVLLDFWASWCVPCREEIPFLKNIYNKFHLKGFEIVAISVDIDRNAWLSAIKQESIEMWFHIPVAEKYALGLEHITNDDIYYNYFVQCIPVIILIDKNGKIAGRWVGASIDNKGLVENKLTSMLK